MEGKILKGAVLLLIVTNATFGALYLSNNSKIIDLEQENAELEEEVTLKENEINMTRSNMELAQENLNRLNESFNLYKDQAYVYGFVNSFYEGYDHDNVVSVGIVNLADDEASEVTGICGLYENSNDDTASDAFYIDLENVASGSIEYRSYGFGTEEYDIDSKDNSIICHVYSAENGMPSYKQISSINENIESWEELADESDNAEKA